MSSSNKIKVYSGIAIAIIVIVVIGLIFAVDQIFNNINNDELDNRRVNFTKFILLLLIILFFFLFIYLGYGAFFS